MLLLGSEALRASVCITAVLYFNHVNTAFVELLYSVPMAWATLCG
jgi:hypothetical protein